MLNAGGSPRRRGLAARRRPRAPGPLPRARLPDRDRRGADPRRHGPAPAAAEDAARHYGTADALARSSSSSRRASPSRSTWTRSAGSSSPTCTSTMPAAWAAAPSVPIVIQRREWEAAHDAAAIANFYLPADYAGLEERIVLVDGDHDLLGDGSVAAAADPRPHAGPPVGRGRRAAGDRRRRHPLRQPASTTTASRPSPTTSTPRRRRPNACAALRDAGADVLPGPRPGGPGAGSGRRCDHRPPRCPRSTLRSVGVGASVPGPDPLGLSNPCCPEGRIDPRQAPHSVRSTSLVPDASSNTSRACVGGDSGDGGDGAGTIRQVARPVRIRVSPSRRLTLTPCEAVLRFVDESSGDPSPVVCAAFAGAGRGL